MAYLNMFTNQQERLCTSFIDPRISFSNDFAETYHATKHESKCNEAPVSSDFEFSVKNYAMIPADEIFFDGVLLPLKDDCTNRVRKMTLREELLVDDEFSDPLPRLPKNSSWWKERLGLRRNDIVPKKVDGNGVLKKVTEEKRPVITHDDRLLSKKAQNHLAELLESHAGNN